MDAVTVKLVLATAQKVVQSKKGRYLIVGILLLIFLPLLLLLITVMLFAGYTLNTGSALDSSASGSVANAPASNLVKFIELHESYAATAYRGLDYWNETIGYGHVIEPGENYTYLTQDEAQALLINDLGVYVASVQKEFQGVTLSQNQFDALVDICYNLGPYAWPKLNLTADVKSGASADVIHKDMDALDHVGGQESQGLLNRREADFQMYEYGVYEGVTTSKDYLNGTA